MEYGYSLLTKLYNGYGWGFWAGLKDAYSQQDIKSNGKYELVLSLPAEVGDYASKKLSKSKKVNIKNVSAGLYNRGFQDGQKFGNIRKLQNALPV